MDEFPFYAGGRKSALSVRCSFLYSHISLGCFYNFSFFTLTFVSPSISRSIWFGVGFLLVLYFFTLESF